MPNTQRHIRQNARERYARRRNGNARPINPYIADSIALLSELDGLFADTNRCGHCNAKAGHPHDGDCRTTLAWHWHECVDLNIQWSGWVLQFGSGRRIGYVLRQIVPTPKGMRARWTPFTWDGAQLANAGAFPQTAHAVVEQHTGTGHCPVRY